MAETHVAVERWIGAPVENVWRSLTDLESTPEILSGVQSVEVLTPGPFREGTRWRETRRMLGRTATEDMEVTTCREPDHCVVEAEAHGAHYVSEFTLTPESGPEGGTTVRMDFTARPPGGMAGVMMRVLGGLSATAIRQSVEKDLADVAAHVERPTPSGGSGTQGPDTDTGPGGDGGTGG